MKIGAGDPNKDWTTSLHHRTSYKKNKRKTFQRMFMFLNPLSQLLISNWHVIVRPK